MSLGKSPSRRILKFRGDTAAQSSEYTVNAQLKAGASLPLRRQAVANWATQFLIPLPATSMLQLALWKQI